jgi:hypothetical protein
MAAATASSAWLHCRAAAAGAVAVRSRWAAADTKRWRWEVERVAREAGMVYLPGKVAAAATAAAGAAATAAVATPVRSCWEAADT